MNFQTRVKEVVLASLDAIISVSKEVHVKKEMMEE